MKNILEKFKSLPSSYYKVAFGIVSLCVVFFSVYILLGGSGLNILPETGANEITYNICADYVAIESNQTDTASQVAVDNNLLNIPNNITYINSNNKSRVSCDYHGVKGIREVIAKYSSSGKVPSSVNLKLVLQEGVYYDNGVELYYKNNEFAKKYIPSSPTPTNTVIPSSTPSATSLPATKLNCELYSVTQINNTQAKVSCTLPSGIDVSQIKEINTFYIKDSAQLKCQNYRSWNQLPNLTKVSDRIWEATIDISSFPKEKLIFRSDIITNTGSQYPSCTGLPGYCINVINPDVQCANCNALFTPVDMPDPKLSGVARHLITSWQNAPGANIKLVDSNNTFIGSTVSNSSGFYTFDDIVLPNTTYSIEACYNRNGTNFYGILTNVTSPNEYANLYLTFDTNNKCNNFLPVTKLNCESYSVTQLNNTQAKVSCTLPAGTDVSQIKEINTFYIKDSAQLKCQNYRSWNPLPNLTKVSDRTWEATIDISSFPKEKLIFRSDIITNTGSQYPSCTGLPGYCINVINPDVQCANCNAEFTPAPIVDPGSSIAGKVKYAIKSCNIYCSIYMIDAIGAKVRLSMNNKTIDTTVSDVNGDYSFRNITNPSLPYKVEGCYNLNGITYYGSKSITSIPDLNVRLNLDIDTNRVCNELFPPVDKLSCENYSVTQINSTQAKVSCTLPADIDFVAIKEINTFYIKDSSSIKCTNYNEWTKLNNLTKINDRTWEMTFDTTNLPKEKLVFRSDILTHSGSSVSPCYGIPASCTNISPDIHCPNCNAEFTPSGNLPITTKVINPTPIGAIGPIDPIIGPPIDVMNFNDSVSGDIVSYYKAMIIIPENFNGNISIEPSPNNKSLVIFSGNNKAQDTIVNLSQGSLNLSKISFVNNIGEPDRLVCPLDNPCANGYGLIAYNNAAISGSDLQILFTHKDFIYGNIGTFHKSNLNISNSKIISKSYSLNSLSQGTTTLSNNDISHSRLISQNNAIFNLSNNRINNGVVTIIGKQTNSNIKDNTFKDNSDLQLSTSGTLEISKNNFINDSGIRIYLSTATGNISYNTVHGSYKSGIHINTCNSQPTLNINNNIITDPYIVDEQPGPIIPTNAIKTLPGSYITFGFNFKENKGCIDPEILKNINIGDNVVKYKDLETKPCNTDTEFCTFNGKKIEKDPAYIDVLKFDLRLKYNAEFCQESLNPRFGANMCLEKDDICLPVLPPSYPTDHLILTSLGEDLYLEETLEKDVALPLSASVCNQQGQCQTVKLDWGIPKCSVYGNQVARIISDSTLLTDIKISTDYKYDIGRGIIYWFAVPDGFIRPQANSCQCDLGAVTSNYCSVNFEPMCTGKFDCQCNPIANPIPAPSLFGYNISFDGSSDPSTPKPPNTHLKCIARVDNTNYFVSNHWIHSYRSIGMNNGFVLEYRLKSEDWNAKNSIVIKGKTYTDFTKYNQNSPEGIFEFRVKAFEDKNNNNILDRDEKSSDWSNICSLEITNKKIHL
jgi:hypothetical protein